MTGSCIDERRVLWQKIQAVGSLTWITVRNVNIRNVEKKWIETYTCNQYGWIAGKRDREERKKAVSIVRE